MSAPNRASKQMNNKIAAIAKKQRKESKKIQKLDTDKSGKKNNNTKRKNQMRKITKEMPRRYQGNGMIQSQKGIGARTTVTQDVTEILTANELVTLVNGTPGFNNQSFYINPGNTALFPIASVKAQCYTNWKLIDFKMTYCTEGYQIATGSTAGNVLAVVNYDPQETPFVEYKHALNYNPHMETVPFEGGFIEAIRKTATLGAKGHMDRDYLIFPSNNQAVPIGTNASVNDYNLGLLQLITNKNSVTSEIGKWHVSAKFYVSGLRQPNPANFSPICHIQSNPTSGNIYVAPTTQLPGSTNAYTVYPGKTFDVNNQPVTSNANAISITDMPINSVFQIQIQTYASTSVTTGVGVSSLVNCTATNVYNFDTVATASATSGTTSIYVGAFRVNAVNISIIFTTALVLTGTGTNDTIITLFPVTLIAERERVRIENVEKTMYLMSQEQERLKEHVKELTVQIEEFEIENTDEAIMRNGSSSSIPHTHKRY